MSGRGIVEEEVFRSELIEANARTSDPTFSTVGDLWIRSDVQPNVSGATTVAALRIQGSGGVLEVPLFDSSEASNLGADVYVGERRRFDDGTVGFIAVTDQGGSLGSPRLLAPDRTEYEAHDALEVSAIPDSVVSRPTDDGSTSGEADKWALIVETKSEWPSLGARISQNTSGATRGYLHYYDDVNNQFGSLIQDVDISSLSSGDVFTFDNVNLQANDKFIISLDAEGGNYTAGYNTGSVNFPYTTADIDIIKRYDGRNDTFDTNATQIVNDIGNPDGVLG